jgi:D-glycero-alpha-D-manno-heptose 1-phosphate guanylyltransferase
MMMMSSETNIPSRIESVREDTPAVLLVGGLGARLRSILPTTPKPLAPVGDAPFLRLLVLQLRSQGIRHLVMCTGHLASQIEQEFGDGREWNVVIEYSEELSPLGTAGAVKLAGRILPDVCDFVVMNGDSFLEIDFQELIRFHRKHGGLISMATRAVPDAARYGTVQVNDSNRVVGFREKTGLQVPGVINGGVYVFNRRILEMIPHGPTSLERDVFPHLLDQGIYGLEQHGIFIDIGTPEDYLRAQALNSSLLQAVHIDSGIGAQFPRAH